MGNKNPRRIFLIGPMGAGKTTIGRRLAKIRGLGFHDCDHYIQERTGVDIPYIFDKEGEEGFRDREQRAIDELTQKDNIVLATGGGVVMREQNRRMLAERGLVVYLQASVDQQYSRTRRSKNRPLLKTANPRERLEELFLQRDPLYREIADLVVVTDGSTRGLAKRISRQIDALNAETATGS